MKKIRTFSIVLILSFVFLFININNITKAFNSTSAHNFNVELKNENVNDYHKNRLNIKNTFYFHKKYLNERNKNLVRYFNGCIEFISRNTPGFIFLISPFIFVCILIRNRYIKYKYGYKQKKYQVKRNKNNRNTIYLVSNNKNNKNKFLCHHIVNAYTLVQLGYTSIAKDKKDFIKKNNKDNNFSKKERREYFVDFSDSSFEIGKNIVIYNISFNIIKIIDN